MKSAIASLLALSVALAPLNLYAQHGHGGGGGGFRGGPVGHSSFGGHPGGGAPHGYAGHPGGGHPVGGHPGNFAGHNFSNRPGYHGAWYHGDWHGHWGGPWGYHPWGWGWYGGWGGFGWGLGLGLGAATVGLALASPWSWGYYSYYNPYWAPGYGVPTYINYSQPVVVVPPATQALPAAPPPTTYAPSGYPPSGPAPAPGPAAPGEASLTPAQQQAMAQFDTARSRFKQRDYQGALSQTDTALAALPNDSVMHEFRALCLFATKDYQQSAAAVYAVVSAGPGWDWTTVSNLYTDINDYTQQLRQLEAYCEQHPQAAAPRFLLGYHYLLAGHNDQAAGLFAEVVKLQPTDQLASQLLKGLTTPANQQPTQQQGPTLEPAAPVDATAIVGNWKATREDGSRFELNLTPDSKFNWKFNQQDRQQQMSGTYTLANNFLILSASNQNSLVGQVAMEPGNRLKFKLAGGNPAEPGLTFTR